METSGRIIAVLEERSGVSAAGREWKSQSYVIEINDGAVSQYPRRMVFDLFGERIDQFRNLLVLNSDIKVSFDIDAREYQGRWFNSIRAWKIEPAQAFAQPAQPQQYAQPAQPQYAQPVQPQQYAQPVSNPGPMAGGQAPAQPIQGAGQAEDNSDLPF